MLKLKFFKQSRGYCGPASLKIVMDFYGIKKSEKEIARLAGATCKHGTTWRGMVGASQSLGLDALYKENVSIKKIRELNHKKIPVIVNWFSENEGHYSVVAGIDDKTIKLLDPEIGKIRALKVSDFQRVWFGLNGDYLKKKSDLRLRPMIVIKKWDFSPNQSGRFFRPKNFFSKVSMQDKWQSAQPG